jgi:hypothetical protein
LYRKIMMFNYKKLPNCKFQSGYTIFHSHQPWKRVCVCSTSSSAFGAVSVTDFRHPNRCAVVCYCFSLYFSDDICCWASFHLLICHLCIIFRCVCLGLQLILKTELLSCCWVLRVLCTFWISHLSHVSFADFSPNLWLVFSFSWWGR